MVFIPFIIQGRFEKADDPSLHAMKRLAMDYDMDTMIANMNINLCEVIHDMKHALEMLNVVEKQRAAVICTRQKNEDPESVVLRNEYIQKQGYITTSFLQIESYDVNDHYIDEIIEVEGETGVKSY